MLKTRVITAAVLLAVLYGLVFVLPKIYFLYFTLLVIGIGFYEWFGFAKYPVAIKAVLSILGVMLTNFLWQHQEFKMLILVTGALAWCILSILLFSFPKCTNIIKNRIFHSIMAFAVLVPTFYAINSIFLAKAPYSGDMLLIFVCFAVFSQDIGAYFAGRKFGRRKLAPEVSPGKTIEGSIGGIGLSIVTITIFDYFMNFTSLVMVIAVVTVIFSIVGDLAESMFKRVAIIKDSGSILPGHGGVLDRIDSLTAALPMFTLGLMLIDKL